MQRAFYLPVPTSGCIIRPTSKVTKLYRHKRLCNWDVRSSGIWRCVISYLFSEISRKGNRLENSGTTYPASRHNILQNGILDLSVLKTARFLGLCNYLVFNIMEHLRITNDIANIRFFNCFTFSLIMIFKLHYSQCCRDCECWSGNEVKENASDIA
jgi:hypothetical protein